jgi:hypothetical protein
MEVAEIAPLVEQLAAGFQALQEEYQTLFGHHESLQRKLATAREQVSSSTLYFVLLACLLL